MKLISHNKPTLGKQEIEAVKKVLQSYWLIAGKEVRKLEDKIKKLIRVNFAIAVNSGTSALHLSLISLNVGRGDEVILPAYTASDILNPIFYLGAIPVLVDIGKNGFNIDILQIRNKISPKTKAIIIPHTFGFPAKIDEIKKYKIPVIEDCAQALGSYYQKKPVGSFGDISIFSFYTTKMIATGQGGMVITNNKKYFDNIKDLIDYNGRDNFKVRYNYPMTDITASIGNVQLEKLPLFVRKRHYIASRYLNIIEKKDIQYWPKREDKHVNQFRFVIKFDSREKRDRVKRDLLKKGIATIVPIASFELLHILLKQDKRSFPNAQRLAETSLSLPMYPSLTEREIEKITRAIDDLL